MRRLIEDGIVFVGQLAGRSEVEMLRTPNFGRKSLDETREVLRSHGLHFEMDIRGWTPPHLAQRPETPTEP